MKKIATPTLDRLIRFDELHHITGLSASSLWRYEKAGLFPRRVKLAPSQNSAVAWRLSDVKAWMDALPGVDYDSPNMVENLIKASKARKEKAAERAKNRQGGNTAP